MDDLALPFVVCALRDPLTVAAASVAVGRLGDAAPPAMDDALSGGDPAGARRFVAAVARSAGRDRVLTAHIRHEDAVLGLTVLSALAGPGPSPEGTRKTVGLVVADDVAGAVRVLEATVTLEDLDDVSDTQPPPDADRALLRFLADELQLLTRRVGAALTVAHGTDAVDGALVVLGRGEGEAGVAVEMLEVVVGPGESTPVIALLDPRLGPGERLARLRDHGPAADSAAGLDAALRALVEARPGQRGPTPWLRACSVGAAGRRGLLAEWDLSAARALGDPVVDEQLAATQ